MGKFRQQPIFYLRLSFFRRDTGLDRAVAQTSMELFHCCLYLLRDLIIEIVKGSIRHVSQIVPAGKAAIFRAL